MNRYFYGFFLFSCLGFSSNFNERSFLPLLEMKSKELYRLGDDNNYIYSKSLSKIDFQTKFKDYNMSLLEEGDDDIELSLAECVFMPKGAYGRHITAELSIMMAQNIMRQVDFSILKVIRIEKEKVLEADGLFSAQCALAFVEGSMALIMQAQAMD